MPQPQTGFMPPRICVYVKNVSAQSYLLTELGITLTPNQEIDMTDPAAEHHYQDSSAAWRAANELPNASLYIGTHSTPPKLTVRFVPATE